MDVVVTLTDGQIDALADSIAARLSTPAPPGMVDAAALAAHLGVARSFVYEHALELGGKRLPGKRGRLRFDLEAATSAFSSRSAEQPLPMPRRPKRTSHSVGSVLKVRT